MGDAFAVEPPVPRVRRHRLLTGTSGLLLFVCLFLPAVKGCSSAPIHPYEVPPFWLPYIYGAVFSVVALARTQRGLELGTNVLRALAVITIAAGGILLAVMELAGIIQMLVGIAMLCVIDLRGVSERRVAASGLLVGLLCSIWFGLWAGSQDALYGVFLSLGSSLGILVGSFVWIFEAIHVHDEPMPIAVILPAAQRRYR